MASGVGDKATYIAASYVKNLQMAGAQVVPIFYNQNYLQLEEQLSKINGVFFPGGEMPIAYGGYVWLEKTLYIFQYA